MPQIVAAALAQTAVAAPVAAATIAPTAAGIGAAATQTAALEAAKQVAIKEGMKQAGLEATKQVGLEAGKQAAVEAGKQSAVEASKQGIAQGFQQTIPQAADDAASLAARAGDPANMARAQEFLARNPMADASAYTGGTPFTPSAPAAPATPLPPAGSAPNLEALKQSAIQSGSPQFSQAQIVGSGSPVPPQSQMLAEQAARIQPVTQGAPLGQSSAFRQIPVDEAIQNELRNTAARTGERFASEQAAEQLAADPLRRGIAKGVELVKKYPMESGMAAMSLGQYMNQPEEEDKGKYKNKVDMSEFKPSLPSVGEFKPSYEYQKYAAKGGLMGYAVGGPVEMMSAQNAVGDNTMYPQSQLQTPMYSNPAVQRPMAMNVISQGIDAPVDPYTGEQKFAEGGISEEMAREYGLKNRKQRAAKSLTKDYEEMESQRTKDANELLSERSGSGIIPRSRTQQLSSPFSAAIEEHNRLAKKTKTPKFETPKTSLGDIDTYMDIPVEAAGGGIMGNLGGYSDGGRLLRGPGDGVSDSIPAVIGKRQPARLADGEFVIPARIVSELGNGSTEAGARKLYAMMERIQNTRKKSIGKKKVAVNSRADKHLPA
jgi:hypothetical protein